MDKSIFISEIIELAWDDEVSFDTILKTHGVSEKEVILIMRDNMKASSFKMWRKRVSGRKKKHLQKLRPENTKINDIDYEESEDKS